MKTRLYLRLLAIIIIIVIIIIIIIMIIHLIRTDFEERGKPEYLEKNLSGKSIEPTNSTHK